MGIKYLNGDRLYYCFAAGYMEVSKHRKSLNSINVFPVADGDTGNNLVTTLNYVIEEVKPVKFVGKTLQLMSDAVITGARGNSGIIMAQFINGLSEEIGDREILDTASFSESLQRSVHHAYNSISNPVEGTMLTVMKDWSEAVYRFKNANDFIKVVLSSIETAKKSLVETQLKNSVLKKAKVVDSGGQGFVHFLDGIAYLINKGSLRDIAKMKKESLHVNIPADFKGGKVTDRYCSNGLIKGENLNLEAIKDILNSFGGSAIVAGNSKKARVHVHTNSPQNLFFRLRDFGSIKHQKVEDMKIQNTAVSEGSGKIALVTDSIADLPKDFVDKHNIHVVPINLNIGDSVFLDKFSIFPKQLYSVLDKVDEYPSTSQPSVKAIKSTLSFLADYYDSVIVVTVSKELSGTWEGFKKAAKEIEDKGKKISVINSKLNSGAQGLLVVRAAEEIANGTSHDEIVEKIESWIPNTKIFVSLSTLKYMVKGGRISPMKGKMANLLNLKPIASLDEEGKGIVFDKAFSRKGNAKKIFNLVKRLNGENPIERYAIVHAAGDEKVMEFEKELTRILGKRPAYIMEISPAIALNAGLDSIAVALTS